ncbi:MAG: ribose ABC transporter permease [Pirellulaceae bacterium]
MFKALRARVPRLLDSPSVLAFAGLILLCLAMSFVSDRFATWDNLQNVMRQVSINAIIAAGMTVVILSGGIDLSVGAVMALSMTLTASALLAEIPIPLAIAIGLATGAGCGAINGLLIAYGRLPAIIVTLAMMEIPRGLALLKTGGYPQSGLPSEFSWIGQGNLFGLQTPIVVMLVVFAALFALLAYFPVGRYIYGIGGNEEAVRLSGVRVERTKLLAYTISGVTAAIAGIVLASRLMSGQPNAGIGFELDAIAAVVLGGTAIVGGRGSMIGTLIGALTLGVLNNGLNFMSVSPYTQKVLKGAIILLAIYAGSVKRKL